MIAPRLHAVAVLACLAIGGSALGQGKGDAWKQMAKFNDEANRRMSEIVSTKDYQEELPFGKFLESLSKQLSTEKKFTVRLDRYAFGKDADKILSEKIVLPPVPTRMTVNVALRLALSQTPCVDYGIEFLPGRNELVITTRDRSLYSAVYDIQSLLKEAQVLHQELEQNVKRNGPQGALAFLDFKADSAKPDEWIVRQIVALAPGAGWRHPTRPSTIQVRNGTKLVIHAPPSVHQEISSMLNAFRRLADIAVVMNARIYEVDRAAFERDFLPLFADPKDKTSRRLVARVTERLVKKLNLQKLVAEGDAIKIRPHQQEVFLSVRNAYPYRAKPGDAAAEPAKVFGTVYDGVVFKVRPAVSSDRRCLRLELSQQSDQLVKFTKGTVVDLKTGKDVSIELPNVKKMSTSAIIEIHDGQPIVMVVDYRPREKDRVWVLLAEPMIYMEEEQERIRKEAIKPMLGADEKPAPPDPPVEVEPEPVTLPPVPLPNTAEMKELLQAVIVKVMSDPEIKEVRGDIGTPGSPNLALTSGNTLTWPMRFQPTVPGFKLQKIDPIECLGFKPRMVGLRLESFDRDASKPMGWEIGIQMTMHNAGGNANGGLGFKNSSRIYCKAKRANNRWVVDCFAVGQFERVEAVR